MIYSFFSEGESLRRLIFGGEFLHVLVLILVALRWNEVAARR